MLPTIPTDNLFKFFAVSGLILAGFCVWVSNDVENRLRANEIIARDQYVEFIGVIEDKYNAIAAKADATATKDEAKQVAIILVVVPDPNGKPVLIKPGTLYPLAIEEKYREGYRRVITYWDSWLASNLPHAGQAGPPIFTPAEVKDLRAKLRQHNIALENLWRQTDYTTRYRTWAFVGMILGTFVCGIGFSFWVFGQKRQDALEGLKIQKDKKELNSEKDKKEPNGVAIEKDTKEEAK